jgi:hypothetical protein
LACANATMIASPAFKKAVSVYALTIMLTTYLKLYTLRCQQEMSIIYLPYILHRNNA